MAKNEMTEEKLSKGVGSLGGFASSMRSRRPTPFDFDIPGNAVPAQPIQAAQPVSYQVEQQVVTLKPSDEIPPVLQVLPNITPVAPRPTPKVRLVSDFDLDGVTVPVRRADRKKLKDEAQVLQDQRTVRFPGTGFTATVLMRLGIRLVAEYYKVGPQDKVANEEELYQILKMRLNLR